MHRPALLSFIFAGVALCVAAAEVRLGPEMPLSPAAPAGPAAGLQTTPDVASSGRDFLAVWTDYRSSSYGDIWISRLTTYAAPVRPFGRRLETGTYARIASNGEGYLLASIGSGGLHLQHVDDDGLPTGDARIIPVRTPVELVSNGSTYLLITSDTTGRVPELLRAMIMDGTGLPLVQVGRTFDTVIATGAHERDYYVIEGAIGCQASGCRTALTAHVITETGVARTVQLLTVEAQQPIAAAFSPTAILIAWRTSASVAYALVDYDGVVRKTQEVASQQEAAEAQWDGRQFMLFLSDRDSASAVRISADGSLIDHLPFSVEAGAPRFASTGRTGVLVWADPRFSRRFDIVSRAIATFDDLLVHQDKPALVSYSAPPATQPQIARSGDHVLAVWIDPESATLNGSLDGLPLMIVSLGLPAGAVVSAGTRTFLVTWYDYDMQSVLAKRIGFDGAVLDTEALTLDTNVVPFAINSFADVLSSAFDGSSYRVIWTEGDIVGIRVTEDGALTDPIVASGDAFGAPAYSPRLLFAPGGYFLAYAIFRGSGVIQGPSIGAWWSAINGTPLSTIGSAAARPALFEDDRVALVDAADDGNRVIYAWSSKGDLIVAQSTLEAIAIGEPRLAVRTDSIAVCGAPWLSRPSVLWNSAETVIVWSEGDRCTATSSANFTVRAIRLDRNLDPIDSAPFVIANDATADAASLMNTADGVAIEYSRMDAENGGTPRVFIRTLVRVDAPPPRRRGVRH